MNSLEQKLLLFIGNEVGVECVNDLLAGKFGQLLEGPVWDEVFNARLRTKSEGETLEAVLQDSINLFTSQTLTVDKQIELLCFGISSLMAFIQNNWTGPITEYKTLSHLSDVYGYTEEECKSAVLECLLLDGEGICSVANNIELLLLARVVFKSNLSSLRSSKWWLLRCIIVHQKILDEYSSLIHAEMQDLIEPLKAELKSRPANGDSEGVFDEETNLHAILNLEIVQAYLHYRQTSKSEKEIKDAFELINMEVNFVGALGKRTFFQVRELAQLTIDLKLKEKTSAASGKSPPDPLNHTLPDNIALNDEVCVDGIKFSDPSASSFPDLAAVEQAALLALFIHTQASRPKDELQKEELLPFLTCLISQPKFWSIQTSALRLRSLLEQTNSRRVDRSLRQLESLVENFHSDKSPAHCRLQYFFCSYLPPRWSIEADLATVLISLGAVQSALDVYLRLEMWEEVIACYNFLKMRHKAAEVVRQEMSKKETVKLWCLLGDATDDVTCYEKAWQLSDEKSAQAQRHWANYFYERKQYAESIPHYEKSLSINSIQVQVWFRLGYAALEEKQWSLCATAYRRYCSLEPESFEAWNNLAKAYVKQGLKPRACHALKEALRCNFENWMVWDNLMAVSTDCGDFEQIIISYNRILDLKKSKKHEDTEVLRILVDAINGKIPDCNGVLASRLRSKALKLFNRLVSEGQDSADIWQLFAKLLAGNDSEKNNSVDDEQSASVMQCLKHAFRVATQSQWVSTPESCLKIMKLCLSISDVCLAETSKPDTTASCSKDMLSTAKFSLRGVISRIKKEHTDLVTGEVIEPLADGLKELQQSLACVEEKLSTVNKS